MALGVGKDGPRSPWMGSLASLAWVGLIFFTGTSVIDWARSCWTDLSARFIPADTPATVNSFQHRISLLDWPSDKSCHSAWRFLGFILVWDVTSLRITLPLKTGERLTHFSLFGMHDLQVCVSVPYAIMHFGILILLSLNLQIIVLITENFQQFRNDSIKRMVWYISVMTWFSNVMQWHIYVLYSFFYTVCMWHLHSCFKDILNY